MRWWGAKLCGWVVVVGVGGWVGGGVGVGGTATSPIEPNQPSASPVRTAVAIASAL